LRGLFFIRKTLELGRHDLEITVNTISPIVSAVAFLASDGVVFITGQKILCVDGGIIMR